MGGFSVLRIQVQAGVEVDDRETLVAVPSGITPVARPSARPRADMR